MSVITPVHNARRYLEASVGSVLGQSHGDLELLLVDDGSTDGSGELCEALAARDRRISVVRQQQLGPAGARNAGLSRARGEFMFFLDADDWLEPDALETLVRGQTRHDTDLTIGDFRKIVESGAQIPSGHDVHFRGDAVLDENAIVDYAIRYARTPYVFILFVHCWGRLYRSRIIREQGLRFDERLHNFEDVAFNFTFLEHVRSAGFVRQVLYNYRVHSLSQSFQIGEATLFRNYRRAFEAVGRFLGGRASGVDANALVGHLFISCIIIMLLRTCSHRDVLGSARVREVVRETLDDPEVRESLGCYTPSGAESRLLPWLMRRRLAWPTMLLCDYRYRRHQRMRLAAAGHPDVRSTD